MFLNYKCNDLTYIHDKKNCGRVHETKGPEVKGFYGQMKRINQR